MTERSAERRVRQERGWLAGGPLLCVTTIRRTTDTFLFISHTMNVLLFKLRCNIFIGVRIIKEMPGSVASGTSCIFPSVPCFRRQFLCKMWPIRLTFLLYIQCNMFLWSLSLCKCDLIFHTISPTDLHPSPVQHFTTYKFPIYNPLQEVKL
jgi:hypothetical protein